MRNICVLCISLFLLIITLHSCTVEHRVYRPGLYVDWSGPKSRPISASEESPRERDAALSTSRAEAKEDISKESAEAPCISPVEQSSEQSSTTLRRRSVSLLRGSIATGKCDTIILSSGEKMVVELTQGTSTQVRYKDCGSSDNSIRFIDKSLVVAIKHADGSSEEISQDDYKVDESVSVTPKTPKPPVSALAVFSFITAVIGLFLPLVIGLVVILISCIAALYARKQIRSHPMEYRGFGLTTATLIIGVVAFAVLFSLFLIANML